MNGRLSRRTLLSCAAAVALGGCGRPGALLQSLGDGVPLTVYVVGLPSSAAALVIKALHSCAQAYSAMRRGAVRLQCTASPVPLDSWFDCHIEACDPASSAPDQSFFGLSTDGQIGTDGVPSFVVRGRTRLRIQFGDGTLLPPVPATTVPDQPDIVIAYDIWQYWLAPLATDVAEQWKSVPEDTAGIGSSLQQQVRFFAPGVGTYLAAFPLLRNPMVIVNAPPATPWDWSHLVSALSAYASRYAVDAGRFTQSSLYPEATELALAGIVANGGRVGAATSAEVTPHFQSTAVYTAVSDLAAIVAAARETALPGGGGLPVYPTYLWSPLSGVRDAFSLPLGQANSSIQPVPAGSARSAVPCTYLCASVPSASGHHRDAQDFAGFLMNPACQSQLAATNVGFALRQQAALEQAARFFASVPPVVAASLTAAENDLMAEDAYGGDETEANLSSYDGIADGFAAALAAAQARPAAVQAILQQAASA